MKINELEKMLNVSRANIRFYEKEGLLNPSRKENGYREYDENDVAILKKIIIYRKLGISIQDIRGIFDGSVILNDAANKSIGLMQNEISALNVSIELCKEICEKNIEDKNFDEEYYWNEINTREIKGEEFFDFAGVDISGFDNKKRIKILFVIFVALFFIGIIYSVLCAKSYHHNNEYYDVVQKEINTYCQIDTVKTDAVNKMLYLCYDDASCVNVYDFKGNFLWAVFVPFSEYSRGVTFFYLDEGRLIIDRDADIYVYNALTGDFIEKSYAEKLGIGGWRETYDQYHSEDLKKLSDLGFTFDFYNVYTTDENGTLTSCIIQKPNWYILTNDIWGVIISSIGAIGIFLISVLAVLKRLAKIPLDNEKIGKTAKNVSVYLKGMFSVFLAFAILNIVLAIFSYTNFSIIVFPLAFIFIVSLIIQDILTKKFNETEKRVCGIWRNYCLIAFFISIISVIIALFVLNL